MCNCYLCSRNRLIEEIKLKGDVDELKNLIDDLRIQLRIAEEGKDYYRSLISGRLTEDKCQAKTVCVSIQQFCEDLNIDSD